MSGPLASDDEDGDYPLSTPVRLPPVQKNFEPSQLLPPFGGRHAHVASTLPLPLSRGSSSNSDVTSFPQPKKRRLWEPSQNVGRPIELTAEGKALLINATSDSTHMNDLQRGPYNHCFR